MSNKPPKIVIPGMNRGAGIPGGYILGRRRGSKQGPVELLNLAQVGGMGIATAAQVTDSTSQVQSIAHSETQSLSKGVSTSLSGAISSTSSLSSAVSTVISGSISSVNSSITSLSTAVGGGTGQSTSLSQISSSLSGTISTNVLQSTSLSQISSSLSTEISVDLSRINSLSTAVGGGGGGGTIYASNNITTVNTGLFAGRGVLLVPFAPFTMTQAFFLVNPPSNTATYTCYVVTVDASNVVLTVPTGANSITPGSTTVGQMMLFTLTTPVSAVAGTRYGLLCYRTDSIGAATSGTYSGTSDAATSPVIPLATFLRQTTLLPTVGDTLASGSNPYYHGYTVT